MKYFLDTEFIERFYTDNPFGKRRHSVELISIGIVAEDGREYYKISNEYNYNDASPWVQENVILPMYIDTVHGDERNRYNEGNFQMWFGISRYWIRRDIIEFVGDDPSPEFYGYFADYDWVVFCSLFGTMINLPKNFPMYCLDLKQMMFERGLSKEWKQLNCPDPEGAHNALVDARWNRELYNKIKSFKQ